MTDTHHKLFPRREYNSRLERTFRDLASNKVRLPRCIHELIHIEYPVPEKPSREEMINAVAEELGEQALRKTLGK